MVLFYSKNQDRDYPAFYFIPTLFVSSVYSNNRNVLTTIGVKFCTFEFGINIFRAADFEPGSTKEMLKDLHNNVMKSIDEIGEK